MQNSCEAITSPKYMEIIAKTRKISYFLKQASYLEVALLVCLLQYQLELCSARKSQIKANPSIILVCITPPIDKLINLVA